MKNNDLKLFVVLLIAQIYFTVAILFFSNSYIWDITNLIYWIKEERTKEIAYNLFNDEEIKKEKEFEYNLKNDVYCWKDKNDYINKTVKIINEYWKDIEKWSYTWLTTLKEIRIVNSETATWIYKKDSMWSYSYDSTDIQINCDVLNLFKKNTEEVYVKTIWHEYYHYLSHKVSRHDKLNIVLWLYKQNENSLNYEKSWSNFYNKIINEQIDKHFKVLLKDSFERVKWWKHVYWKDWEHEEYQADLFWEFVYCEYKETDTETCNKLRDLFWTYFKNYLNKIIVEPFKLK